MESCMVAHGAFCLTNLEIKYYNLQYKHSSAVFNIYFSLKYKNIVYLAVKQIWKFASVWNF